MKPIDIIAQGFGLVGLGLIVYSFQCKKNKYFFLFQGTGGFMFFINFMLIGAYAGALYNLSNLIRGLLFSKDDKKVWKLALTEILYLGCFCIGMIDIWGDPVKVFLAALPCAALLAMSVVMWMGNGKVIRICQITFMSPSWIVHNIFNFTLGGLICEVFNMISSAIALYRHREKG